MKKRYFAFAIMMIALMFAMVSCNMATNPGGTTTTTVITEPRITDTKYDASSKMKIFNIFYRSEDPYGKPVTLSGSITFGDEVTTDAPAKGIMLYNHYTVYGKNECPSRGDLTIQKFIVGSGLITVSADYYGFGTTGDKHQAYCMANTNARASLDALIAARTLLKDKGYSWDNILFNVGYSQGGQTTIGVLKLAASDDKYSDIKFTYSFAGGGPYDIPETYRQFIKSSETDMPSTVVSVILAYNEYYQLGIKHSDIFKEPLLSHIDEWLLSKNYTQKDIVKNFQSKKLTDYIKPEFLDLSSDMSKKLMEAVSQENLCSGWTPNTDERISVFHNSDDDVVPVANAENLVAFLKSSGLDVTDDENTKSGVFTKITNMGSASFFGIGPHEFGAVSFLLTGGSCCVIDKIKEILNTEWSPSTNALTGLIGM